MKNEIIKNVLHKRARAMDGFYKKIVSTSDPEDIRQFRIEVKKLKAFVGLLTDKRKNAGAVELPYKVDRFYKATGMLRSFQLQHELIEKVADGNGSVRPEAYLSFLVRKIAEYRRIVMRLYKVEHPFKKGMNELLERSASAGSMVFINSKRRLMGECLDPLFPGDETLHSIRKVLKDILHNRHYTGSVIGPRRPFVIFTDMEDVKGVAQQLGKFQDKRAALALLYEYDVKEEDSKAGRKFLTELARRWKDEKESLRREVVEVIQKQILLAAEFVTLPGKMNAAAKPGPPVQTVHN